MLIFCQILLAVVDRLHLMSKNTGDEYFTSFSKLQPYVRTQTSSWKSKVSLMNFTYNTNLPMQTRLGFKPQLI